MDLGSHFKSVIGRGLVRNSLGPLTSSFLIGLPNVLIAIGGTQTILEKAIDIAVFSLPFVAFGLLFEFVESMMPFNSWHVRCGIYWGVTYNLLRLVKELQFYGLEVTVQGFLSVMQESVPLALVFYAIQIATGVGIGVVFAIVYSMIYKALVDRKIIEDETYRE